MGRLPHKISSNHGRYKASQWKNWALIYSIYALHGLLPEEHLNCWHTFVMACRLLTVPTLSHADLTKADMLLLKFPRQFEALYGKDYVRINMHLHCHLKECIEDYGPVYSFWCFAFERFNGVLGSTVTNNRSIEIQLMRKFLSEQFVSNVALPEDFSEHFSTYDVNKLGAINCCVTSCTLKKANTWTGVHRVHFGDPEREKGACEIEVDTIETLACVASVSVGLRFFVRSKHFSASGKEVGEGKGEGRKENACPQTLRF